MNTNVKTGIEQGSEEDRQARYESSCYQALGNHNYVFNQSLFAAFHNKLELYYNFEVCHSLLLVLDPHAHVVYKISTSPNYIIVQMATTWTLVLLHLNSKI